MSKFEQAVDAVLRFQGHNPQIVHLNVQGTKTDIYSRTLGAAQGLVALIIRIMDDAESSAR